MIVFFPGFFFFSFLHSVHISSYFSAANSTSRYVKIFLSGPKPGIRCPWAESRKTNNSFTASGPVFVPTVREEHWTKLHNIARINIVILFLNIKIQSPLHECAIQ